MASFRKALARAWALAGLVLGIATSAAGVFLITLSIRYGPSVSTSAEDAAAGLAGAQHFASVLSEDLGSSASLLSRVSSTIDETSEVLRGVRAVLESMTSAIGGIAGLDEAQIRLVTTLGSSIPWEAIMPSSGASRDIGAWGDVLVDIFELSDRLGEASLKLDSVAASVDSLREDLGGTAAAMEDARGGIERLHDFALGMADEDLPARMGTIAGAVLIFLGLQQVFVSMSLLDINAAGEGKHGR